MPPNNSFKPNLLRYTNNMAGKACHVVGYATQVGLTQALGRTASMHSPYQPPAADLASDRAQSRRYRHSLTALATGLFVVPVFLFVVFRLMFGDEANSPGNLTLWGSVALGSLLAALTVYPFKKIPLWAAALVGPALVSLVLFVWGVSAYVVAA